MKDEIKEILDKLNNSAEHYILYDYETKILLDYITNLQEELQYQKEAELEYNDKHTKLMKVYSNLQEENERYKNIVDELEKWLEKQYQDTENCFMFDKDLKSKYKRDLLLFSMCLGKLKELKGE